MFHVELLCSCGLSFKCDVNVMTDTLLYTAKNTSMQTAILCFPSKDHFDNSLFSNTRSF